MNKFFKLTVIVMAMIMVLGCFIGCNTQTPSPNPAPDAPTQELTRAEISAIYKGVAKSLWQALGKNDPTVQASSTSIMSIEMPNHTHEETGESMLDSYKRNLAINGLFINFVGDLYANEKFVITDEVVSFGVASSTSSMSYDVLLSIFAKLDRENQKVYLEILVSSVDGVNKTYFMFDIGYDFTQNIASSYRMIYYEPGYVFNDQILTQEDKMFLATSNELELYQPSLDAFVNDFEQRREQGVVLEDRFDAEFQRITELAERL